MSFRSLLLTVLMALVISTVAAVMWPVMSGSHQAIQRLIYGQIETTLDLITQQIENLFNPTERILQSLTLAARRKQLPFEDPMTLGKKLVEILRFENGIAWVSFGYADGRFVGAMQAHNQILLINLSVPEGGTPKEWIVSENGELELVDRRLTPGFCLHKREWFKLGLQADDLTWTNPYIFLDGDVGLAAVQPLHDLDGKFLGVFCVDFRLTDVARHLDTLAEEFASDAMVFSTDGELLATSQRLIAPSVIEKVREHIAALDQQEREVIKTDYILTTIETQEENFFVGMRATEIVGGLECISVVLVSKAQTFGWLSSILWRTILATLGIIGLAILAGFFVANRISRPLRAIAGEMQRIGRFDLSAPSLPRSLVKEIRVLSDAVEKMRRSLRSFGSYVPVSLVRELVCAGGSAQLGGKILNTTILFSDLDKFTSYAETIPPDATVKILTRYFETMVECVTSQEGVIDKFLGDGVMALFNVPHPLKNSAASACRAALYAKARLAELTLQEGHSRSYNARIGLHHGEALVGNIGTQERLAYTAIGDSVNLASRLEQLNKIYGTQIIGSAAVREAAGPEFRWRLLDRVAVAGRKETLEVFELVNFADLITPEQASHIIIYEQSLQHYFDGDFTRAHSGFLAIASDDAPAQAMALRIDSLLTSPPIDDWSGVFEMTQK